MKRNDKLLQEAFFKKSSYSDKLKRKFPQYEPQDKLSVDQPGFGAIIDPDTRTVTDAKEAKKRLTGAFGAIIGANSVKNIASRSVKSFPIVISDNIEPETSVMLKRLFEEQYAEYINLLISNQVIDISAYQSGEDGNIAIQALDTLAGTEFGNRKLARQASKGKLDAADFFQNISAYSLIRQESKEYKTGVPMIDALLEDAVVLPEAEAKLLAEYVTTYPEELINLQEASTTDNSSSLRDYEYLTLQDFLKKDAADPGKALNRDKVFELARGAKERANKDFTEQMSDYNDKIAETKAEIAKKEAVVKNATGAAKVTAQAEVDALEIQLDYLKKNKPTMTRLTSTDIVVNSKELAQSLDTTVAEMLLHPKNAALKDRFEKATFLLQSERISGNEYIQYLVVRLGLPLSRSTRGELVARFPDNKVIDPEISSTVINAADADRIKNSERIIGNTMPKIFGIVLQEILEAAGTVASTGAGAAAGFAGGTLGASVAGLTGAAAALGPIGLGLLGGVAGFFIFRKSLGGEGLFKRTGDLLAKIFPKAAAAIREKARLKRHRKEGIMGWERVEALIESIEVQQQSLRKALELREKEIAQPTEEKDPSPAGEFKSYGEKVNPEDEMLSESELKALLNKHRSVLEKMMRQNNLNASTEVREKVYFFLDEDTAETLQGIGEIIEEDILNGEEYYNDLITEAIVQTRIPVELSTTYEYDKKAKPTIRVAPKFSAASTYAYGEVEYDKRELKDRKYNTPLMLTIRFKERYADGTFADNELVAVIGILGVITRIPSEEMAYILKSNSEGQTLKGILKSSSKDKDMIADLLGMTKLKKDVQNLPQSAEIWQDLEKVSRLAVANKLAGKRSDNIANAHLVFSQKEVDDVKADTGIDYLRDKKLSASLMKRYSAMSIMIANDASERLYIYDSPENISWDVVPYSALRNKDTGDQLTSALMKIGRL